MNLDDQSLHYITQISNSKSKKKNRKLMFDALNEEKDKKNSYFHYNENCCICLESPNEHKVITPCNHMFCNSCLGKWMKINNYCPVCKKEFK
jgi:hypothetical protein